MTDPWRYVLSRLDHDPAPVSSAEELDRRAPRTRSHFIQQGILREIAPATSITYHGCGEGCEITPDLYEDRTNGRTVGVYFCKRPGCGPITIEPEALRQWQFHFEGLAEHVASALSAKGGTVVEYPGRVIYLGYVVRARKKRDVFLCRRLAEPDAEGMIRQVGRLQASVAPVVLVPVCLPEASGLLPPRALALSLAEISYWRRGVLKVDMEPLFVEQQPSSAGEINFAEMQLLPQDREVLQCFVKHLHEPLIQSRIIELSGHSKEVVQHALRRLESYKLVTRPLGTKRKGWLPTEAGREFHEAGSRNSRPRA